MILSVIAGALELMSSYILGNKQKIGWILEIVVDLIWIYMGFIYKEIIGVWIVCVPDLFISIRNYLKWSQEEQQQESTPSQTTPSQTTPSQHSLQSPPQSNP